MRQKIACNISSIDLLQSWGSFHRHYHLKRDELEMQFRCKCFECDHDFLFHLSKSTLSINMNCFIPDTKPTKSSTASFPNKCTSNHRSRPNINPKPRSFSLFPPSHPPRWITPYPTVSTSPPPPSSSPPPLHASFSSPHQPLPHH